MTNAFRISISIIALCLLTTWLLSGCGSADNSQLPLSAPSSSELQENGSKRIIPLTVLSTTLVDSYETEAAFSGQLVQSKGELNALRLDERIPSDPYTENYFSDKALLILHIRFSSGSTRFYRFDVAIIENDTLTVHFATIRPNPHTADLAYWCVVLEFDKEAVQGVRHIADEWDQITDYPLDDMPPLESDGQLVYYVPQEGVYQDNPGAAQDTLLASSKNPSAFQEIGNYIYYVVQPDTESFTLYRMTRKGGKTETILRQSDLPNYQYKQLSSWEIHGSHIYLDMSLSLYRYDIETDKAQLLHTDIAEYAILDSDLYYTEHASRTFTIYRMNMTTGKSQILLGDGIYDEKKTTKTLYKDLCVTENALYFATRQPTGIYRYEKGASIPIHIDDTIDEFSITAYKGRVYFVTQNGEKSHLMEYRSDTNAVKKLADISDYSRTVTIQDDQFYYVSSREKPSETPYAMIPIP